MAAPLVIAIHPDEVALGTALILAAADAVRRGGGLVAAWEYVHAATPFDGVGWTEEAVGEMLGAAVATLACPSACLRFAARPEVRTPGVVPAPAVPVRDNDGLLFAPTLAVLAADVAAGALGLIVSDGQRVLSAPDAKAPFAPGVLRLHPSYHGVGWHTEHDAFAEAGFPTLLVSTSVVPNRYSAHEALELCAGLAARMAEDLHHWSGRASPTPTHPD